MRDLVMTDAEGNEVARIPEHDICPCDCDQLAGETCELCEATDA